METEINIRDYIKVVIKWRKLIVAVCGVVTVASIVISLFLPKVYKAGASFMVVSGSKGGLGAAAGQLGMLGLLGGQTSSSSVQILALLRSRTLAEKVIEKYELMKWLFPGTWDEDKKQWRIKNPEDAPSMEDATKELFAHVKVSDDKKSGLIALDGQYPTAEGAAYLPNVILQELGEHIHENTFTAAKRNRVFIEEQLERNKMELLESGKALTAFYTTNRISSTVPTVDVAVSKPAEVEVDSDNLPPGSTARLEGEGIPGVSDAFAETEQDVRNLEKKSQAIKTQLKEASVVKNVPQQVYLQYLILQRELLGQLNGLLSQQYEMAKIEESKQDLSFEVIDWARVPQYRVKPRRRVFVTTGFAMGILGGILLAFVVEYLEKNNNWNPLKKFASL